MGGHHPPDDGPKKPVVCIVLGQTASGKSEVCVQIARRLEGEIVSMDAIKVYAGMDIGTAKSTPAELKGIPQHLVDLVEPHEPFNVARYLEHLEPLLKEIHSRGRLPVIDCGTPLYLKAFLSGMLDGPDPDPVLRSALEARSSSDLHQELARRDPAAAARLHVNDRKRVVRALEFALQTGEPISERQTQFEGAVRDDYRLFLTGPIWSEVDLKARISQRVDRMLERGLEPEVRGILEGRGFSQTAAAAIGYAQMIDYLHGRVTRLEAVDEIKRKTWQLARKQLMWFKRYPQVRWLRTSSDEELRRAAIFLSSEVIGEMRGNPHGLPIGLMKEPRTGSDWGA